MNRGPAPPGKKRLRQARAPQPFYVCAQPVTGRRRTSGPSGWSRPADPHPGRWTQVHQQRAAGAAAGEHRRGQVLDGEDGGALLQAAAQHPVVGDVPDGQARQVAAEHHRRDVLDGQLEGVGPVGLADQGGAAAAVDAVVHRREGSRSPPPRRRPRRAVEAGDAGGRRPPRRRAAPRPPGRPAPAAAAHSRLRQRVQVMCSNILS